MTIRSSSARRITITVREDLIATLDSHVASGVAESRTDLISAAIEHELRRLRRDGIDAEIHRAASEAEYVASDSDVANDVDPASNDSWAALDEIDGGYFNEPG